MQQAGAHQGGAQELARGVKAALVCLVIKRVPTWEGVMAPQCVARGLPSNPTQRQLRRRVTRRGGCRSVLLREGQILEVDSLSELGVYGTFVRRGPLVIVNSSAGHLVRTKAASSDEGGVAAGFAVLDSPYLTG